MKRKKTTILVVSIVLLLSFSTSNVPAIWIKDGNKLKIDLLTPFPDIQDHSNLGYRYFFEVNVTANTTGNTYFASILTLLQPNDSLDQALICYQFCGYEIIESNSLYRHYNITFSLWLWNALIFPNGEYMVNFTSYLQYLDTGEDYYDSFVRNFTLINSYPPETITETFTVTETITQTETTNIPITTTEAITQTETTNIPITTTETETITVPIATTETETITQTETINKTETQLIISTIENTLTKLTTKAETVTTNVSLFGISLGLALILIIKRRKQNV